MERQLAMPPAPFTAVREGSPELLQPLGQRILRLLRLRTGSRSTCRPVPAGVVPCPRVSSRREQDVSSPSLRRWAA